MVCIFKFRRTSKAAIITHQEFNLLSQQSRILTKLLETFAIEMIISQHKMQNIKCCLVCCLFKK